MGMFSNLVGFDPEVCAPAEFTAAAKTGTDEIIGAQAATAQWLEELGVPADATIDAQQQVQAAREAFTAAVVNAPDDAETRARLAQLKTPPAVQHLVGMLTAYDWEFVQLAKELRGYTVAKLVEETKNNSPQIRLKALQLLGKVTEVGLFTDKVEVTHKNVSEEEVEARLRERLTKYLGTVDVVDANEIKPAPPEVAAAADTAALGLDEEIGAVAEVRSSA